MKKQLLSAFIALFCVVTSFAQEGLWVKTHKGGAEGLELMDRSSMPVKYNLYRLNLPMLKNLLQQAPSRETATTSQVIIEFPDGNGGLEQFRVFEASVMHPDLAAQYPQINSYSGQSVKNPASTIRFSVTPFGVHTMMFSDNGATLTDTYTKNQEYYISYNKKDVHAVRQFRCGVTDDAEMMHRNLENDFPTTTDANDSTLRRYRLAMACTVEFTAFHSARAGQMGIPNTTVDQKKAIVMAAMTVTMTRVNFVFERDMAVTMQLIPTNPNVIFVTSDALSNTSSMINQIQTIMDDAVGWESYDIGHVVGTGPGGVAQLASICGNDKARGVTGRPSPVGDPFDIDYVAHEMGHQFGAEHTFNNAYQRSGARAVEPGSGSTIMAYAGISPPDVQNNSDPYFHTVSMDQMFIVIQNSCAEFIPNGNSAPVIPALANYSIPRSTPFVLRGSATDANGDALTYCWEQTNANGALATIDNTPTTDATTGPNFRSYNPTTSPNRYFPSLADILQNNLVPTWEVLPNVARTLNFALTVRDNRSPLGGQTARRNMSVSVVNTPAPFTVTSQNAQNISWAQGSTQTITWNVANTTAAPINAANVNILLSTDGGLTFPVILKADTPNDGTEAITVPTVSGTNCRIMVEASSNIFFAVNRIPFSVGIVTVCESFTSNTVTPIPDGTGTSSANFNQIIELNKVVTGTGTISDVNVSVNVTHPSVRDILLALKHPDGTVIYLWENKVCPQGNFDINFDDSASSAIVCGAPTTGTYKPAGSLSGFNNKGIAGTWALMIADGYSGSTGQVNSWNLEICSQQAAASTDAFEQMSDLAVYPNPNNGNFTVSFTSTTSEDINISVHDIRGRQVMQKSYANTGAFAGNINLSNAEAGVYLVTIQDGPQRITKKIVVQ